MANAIARVPTAMRSVLDERLSHSWGTLSAAVTVYTGAMVGLNAGYLANFDDTASMRFFGIVLEDHGNPVLPSNGAATSTAGDGTADLDVKQPPAFELAIAGVAITDIGRRVYALDNQTGTLSPSATTYANLIGVVKDLVYAANPGSPVAGYALVAPIYNIPAGNQLQVAAVSGAVQVKASTVIITDATVAALTIADPTTGVHDGLEIIFIATTAQAHTLIAPSGFNASGTTATWAAAKGNNLNLVAYAGKWYVKASVGITLS